MKYTFHIVDVFSSTPFGGNQLAVLPDADLRLGIHRWGSPLFC
jgi:predicted PhzF superfamily epimerase YddE/YHI9